MNEQAVMVAYSYLAYGGMSKVNLISMLEYEGFTREQATKAVNSEKKEGKNI